MKKQRDKQIRRHFFAAFFILLLAIALCACAGSSAEDKSASEPKSKKEAVKKTKSKGKEETVKDEKDDSKEGDSFWDEILNKEPEKAEQASEAPKAAEPAAEEETEATAEEPEEELTPAAVQAPDEDQLRTMVLLGDSLLPYAVDFGNAIMEGEHTVTLSFNDLDEAALHTLLFEYAYAMGENDSRITLLDNSPNGRIRMKTEDAASVMEELFGSVKSLNYLALAESRESAESDGFIQYSAYRESRSYAFYYNENTSWTLENDGRICVKGDFLEGLDIPDADLKGNYTLYFSAGDPAALFPYHFEQMSASWIVTKTSSSAPPASTLESEEKATDGRLEFIPVRSDGVNLRSEPTHYSDLVGSVPAGTSLFWYGETGTGLGSDGIEHLWYRVDTENGMNGWARADLIKEK